jgi:hypothetical protein
MALASASLESLVVVFLLCRGRDLDRPNTCILFPFVANEWAQVVLWAHMGSAPHKCDHVNRHVSTLVTFIVCAVPAWFTITAFIFNRIQTRESTQNATVALSFFCACVAVGMLVEQYFVTTGRCTYMGPWGQQVWPVLNFYFSIWPTFQPWVGFCAAASSFVVYLMGIPFALASLHDAGAENITSLIALLIIFIGPQGGVLILVLGKEWGSFWLWAASGQLAIVALFEREIYQLGIRQGFFPDRQALRELARSLEELKARIRVQLRNRRDRELTPRI